MTKSKEFARSTKFVRIVRNLLVLYTVHTYLTSSTYKYNMAYSFYFTIVGIVLQC